MKEEIYRDHWLNGQVMYEIPYINGKQHGLEKCWYSDGQPMYETQYINGKRNGITK